MPYKNTILNRLGSETIARLFLSPVTFELGHEIEYLGKVIRNVFFVEEGMASMTTTFDDGAQIEVGMCRRTSSDTEGLRTIAMQKKIVQGWDRAVARR